MRKIKDIGIFTLPMAHNYGGLLQAFALQEILTGMGYNPLVIRRPQFLPLWISYQRYCLQLRMNGRSCPAWREKKYVTKNTTEFTERYIRQSRQFYFSGDNVLNNLKLDACVVGSDQVWRPEYSARPEFFFLDFMNDTEIRKVAYAASFGVDCWNFSPEQTARCRELVHAFSAVSVREKSGVELCAAHLGITPEWVLDPTCLVEPEVYSRIADDSPEHVSDKLVYYILGSMSVKQQFIDQVARLSGLVAYSLMPKRRYWSENWNASLVDEFVFPSVETWLKGIRDGKIFVTDSFHGCVFAILFQRPFWVLEHTDGGMARFKSLLEIFGLQDRLIQSPDQLTKERLETPINFQHVDEILQQKKEFSLNFLRAALESR